MTERDFSTECHFLRDSWMQSVDIEIERLQSEKLRVIDEIDRHVAKLLASKAKVREATDPVMGLPKISMIDEDFTGMAQRLEFLGKTARGDQQEAT